MYCGRQKSPDSGRLGDRRGPDALDTTLGRSSIPSDAALTGPQARMPLSQLPSRALRLVGRLRRPAERLAMAQVTTPGAVSPHLDPFPRPAAPLDSLSTTLPDSKHNNPPLHIVHCTAACHLLLPDP
jgi:hypothetical protein